MYYPKLYPVVGLQYYSLGKLYWYLEDSKNAFKYFKKAANVLSKLYGRNHEQVKELYSLLQQAEHAISIGK